MTQIFELVTETDLSKLQHLLDQPQVHPYALPIRHVLWYTRRKIFHDGHIYVDQWPQFNHVCALHTSNEFLPSNIQKKHDFDIAAFFSQSLNEKKCEEFEKFLRQLALERRWTIDRSMWAHFALVSEMDTFKKVFNAYGNIIASGPFKMFTPTPIGLTTRDQRRSELENRLPKELFLDDLNENDLVMEGWPEEHMPLEVSRNYCRWLIETFSSPCIRNKNENDQAVAWRARYGNGGSGRMYVDARFRRQGISEYLEAVKGNKPSENCPYPTFATTLPENLPAMAALENHGYWKCVESDDLVVWFAFYNKNRSGRL